MTFNLFYTHCVTNLGCRQFASWGDRTENGELIHSRNLDWIDYPGSPMKKFNTVVNYKGKDQLEYLLLTWPGFTSALTGTNKEGITIAFNQLPHRGDRTQIIDAKKPAGLSQPVIQELYEKYNLEELMRQKIFEHYEEAENALDSVKGFDSSELKIFLDFVIAEFNKVNKSK